MIELKIPKPCAEKWSVMTPLSVDCRHCVQCSKSIIDFTQKSDAEILQYIRQQDGRVCGRFRHDQIQRALHAPQKKGWGSKALTAGLLSMIALPVWAQHQQMPIEINHAARQEAPQTPGQDSTFRIISGKIIDPDTGESLIGAVVQYRNFGTATDLDGYFHLRIPLSALHSPDEPLHVYYTGFSPLEITLPARILQEDLSLLPQVMEYSKVLMGEVVVTRVRPTESRMRRFWRKWFH